MKIIYSLTIFLLVFSPWTNHLYSQNKAQIDSLQELYNRDRNRTFDSVQHLRLEKIIGFYETNDLKKAVEYTQEGIKQNEKSGNFDFYIHYRGVLATLYRNLEMYDQAIVQYQNVKHLREKNGMNTGWWNNSFGNLYYRYENYNQALKYYKIAIWELAQLDHKINSIQGITVVLSNIGLVYREKGDTSLALGFFKSAYRIRQHHNLHYELSYNAYIIGQSYIQIHQYDSAIHYLQQGVKESYLGESDYFSIHNQTELALVYSKTNQIEKALETIEQAEKKCIENNVTRLLPKTYLIYGTVYLESQNFEKSHEYALRGKNLADSLGMISEEIEIMEFLAMLYKKYEQDEQLIQILEELRIKESNIKTLEAQKLQLKFELEENNLELQRLSADISYLSKQNRAQVIIIGLIIIMFIGGLIFALVLRNRLSYEKKVAIALKISQKRYKSLFENATDGILILDDSGIFIDCNEQAQNIFGYTRNELIGQSPLLISTAHQANGLKSVDMMQQYYNRARNKEDLHFEWQNTDKTGKIFTSEVTFFSFAENNVVILYAIVKDISMRKAAQKALKESEAKLRSILDGFIDDIYVVSADWKLKYINKTMRDKIGADKIGQKCHKVLYDRDKPCPWCIKEELTPEKKYVSIELENEGRYKLVRNILLDNNEKLIVSYDVTEQKLQEKQLRELIATKDKFFNIIAHDLRSPFNSIIGFSDLLLNNHAVLNPAEKLQYLKNLNQTANNTLKLLENLLIWSRSQSGRLPFNPENLEIDMSIRETIQLLENNARSKEIELVYTPTPLHALADKNMLSAVIRNLMSNALKFTPRGGKIVIAVQEKSPFIEISITDNGIGMPPEAVEKLFKIEQNYSRKGTENESGTGLGLILVQDFVKKNGGEIVVQSTENKGTTFRFTVPGGQKTQVKSVAELSPGADVPEKIKAHPELYNIMVEEIQKDFYDAYRTFSLKQIGSFANHLEQFAKKNQLVEFDMLTQSLKTGVKTFDVNLLNTSFSAFENFLEQLTK